MCGSSVEPGEWVLVHAGLAVTKISEQEAQETLALLQEMSDAFLGEDAAIDVASNFAAPSS
jgi:hydrogenase assembly chaperone HypC/HupF